MTPRTPEQTFRRLASHADWLPPDALEMSLFEGDPERALFVERGALVPAGFTATSFLIGRNSFYQCQVQIPNHVVMGRYCSINAYATLGAFDHRMDQLTTGIVDVRTQIVDELPSAAIHAAEVSPTVIGCDVWIGVNAVVRAGLTIGHGAVIGAGAIVTRSVEPYAVVVGNPARQLRWRFDAKQRQRLLVTRWWELDPEQILALPRHDLSRTLDLLEQIRGQR